MVISHKPLKLIIAILIAFLPTFGFSNTPIHTAQTTTEKAGVAHETEAKPTDEKSKVKAEVHYSTRKIKRQKGTGGARAGSIKSGVFVGGGRIHGPSPRDYSFKLNKKLK